MSEQSPIDPGQLDPTNIDPEVLQQQSAIREMAEGRVKTTPMDQTSADYELGEFGFEAGTHDVYEDTEPVFGGGFKKFVSKENPADVRVGYTKPHIGGNMSSPNRYLYNIALAANGDITEKVSVENAEGTSGFEHRYIASATDPDAVAKYRRELGIMNDDAKYLATKSDRPRRGGSMSLPEVQNPARESRLRKLGRSLFR